MHAAIYVRPSPEFWQPASRVASLSRSRPPRGALIGLALALASLVQAQPDCRSVLGAHLKPLYRESPLSWAGELVTIPAYLENRYANNSMLLAGVDFTTRSKTHQFYFEGGVKRSTINASSHSDTAEVVVVGAGTELGTGTGTSTGTGKDKPATAGTGETNPTGTEAAGETAVVAESGGLTTQTKYGWRELFYQYSSASTRVRAGLSTTRLGDYFLVNERLFGVTYSEKFGGATINAAVGTVGEYARMTDFCGTKRLTNLVDKEKYETVSEDFGDTNMAGVVATWDLRKQEPRGTPAAANEFSLSTDLAPKRSGFSVAKVGLLAYHELDTRTDENRTWVGALAQADLPGAWSLKAQAMYQNGTGPDALIYYGLAEKELFWANASNTSFHAGYFGKYDLDGPARFEASFSNLFKGEIMRMDAIDVPLLFTGVRHNFAGKRKLYLQLQAVRQLNAEKMKEVDFEIGADFFRRLRVVAIGSYVYSTVTKERENLVAKMEIRLGF